MEPKTESAPFQWGDRVDHKKFGLGTIEGEPEGEKVVVKWDDPKRAPTGVMSSFLRLVTRPDAKGGAFWNHEYKKLVDAVKSARATTDNAIGASFRPMNDDGLAALDQSLAAERTALDALRDFLIADEAGEHP